MQLEDTDNKSTHKIYKFKSVLHIVITSINESNSYLIRPLTSSMTKMNTKTLTKTADENL